MSTNDEASGWSHIAGEWSQSWGGFTAPAQRALIAASGVAPGTRVLDVGCGTGEFLSALRAAGADPVGVDPSEGMRRLAAATGAEVHGGDAEHLPFTDGSFDVVTAVNALPFADDPNDALREFSRVLRPGGRIALAGWAEHTRCELDSIERAVALADGEEPAPDDPLRLDGGLERALADAGLVATASGVVDAAWTAPDDDALVRGVLLGDDEAFVDEMRPVVLAAAAPFRVGGGYALRNALRWAVGRL